MNKTTWTTRIRPSQIIVAIISAIMITTALFSLAPSAGATSVTNNNAEEEPYGAADTTHVENIVVENFTILDGGDWAVRDMTGINPGSQLSAFKDSNAVAEGENAVMFIDTAGGTAGVFDNGDNILVITRGRSGSNLVNFGDKVLQSFATTDYYADPSGTYDDNEAIVDSSNADLEKGDTIITDGSGGVLDPLDGTDYRFFDANGSNSYDSDGSGSYAEDVYETAGSSVAKGDNRITEVVVSSLEDDDLQTVDRNLNSTGPSGVTADNFEAVQGFALSELTGNWYYDNVNGSGDYFDPSNGDYLIFDNNGDGSANAGDIIFENDADPYIATGIVSTRQMTGISVEIQDDETGQDGSTHEDDHLILDVGADTGEVAIPDNDYDFTAGEYGCNLTGITLDQVISGASLAYWDADESGDYTTGDNAIYVDTGLAGTDAVDDQIDKYDTRVIIFETITYSSGSQVTDNSADVGASVSGFGPDKYFLEGVSINNEYDLNEGIIQSDDQNLDSADNILVNATGALTSLPTTIGTTTVWAFIDDSTEPSSPSSGTYEDGDDIVKVTRELGTASYGSEPLENFATENMYFDADNSGQYDSGEPIVGDSDTNSTYQDNFTSITVKNVAPAAKRLDNTYIENAKLWSSDDLVFDGASADTVVWHTPTWEDENTLKLSGSTETVTADQNYFVTITVKSSAMGNYAYKAKTTGFTSASGDLGAFTNANLQYINGAPMDADYYAFDDNVNITIYDNGRNTDSADVNEFTLTVESPSENDDITMYETQADSGVFEGSIQLNDTSGEGGLLVSDDDTIWFNYGGATVYDSATVDDTAPVVENLLATKTVEGQFIKPVATDLNVDILENNGWTAEFSQDDNNFENLTGTGDAQPTDNVTWDGAQYADGSYDFSVTVTDDYGHTSSASTTLIVDNTAPQVTNPVADPAIIDNEHPLSIELSVDVTDNLFAGFAESGVSNVEVDVAPLQYGVDENYVTMSGSGNGTYTYTLAAADINQDNVGTYDLTVRATDNMGQSGYSANVDNSTSITVDVIEDDVAPILENVTVTYPNGQPSEIKQGQTITVSADAVDADSVIDSVEVNAENLGAGTIGLAYTSGNTYENTITVSTDNTGSLQIEVTATDSATNSTSTTTTVNAVALLSEYQITLDEGWNLISLPLLPDSTGIDTVLSGLEDNAEDNVVSVMTYDTAAGEWLTYEPGAPVEGLSTMEDGKAYWIKMETSATLTVNGSTLPAGGEIVPPSYQLDAGWNMVGFTSISSENIATYFDTVRSTVNSMIVMYFDSELGRLRRISSSAQLSPGTGYWVWVDQTAELVPY